MLKEWVWIAISLLFLTIIFIIKHSLRRLIYNICKEEGNKGFKNDFTESAL